MIAMIAMMTDRHDGMRTTIINNSERLIAMRAVRHNVYEGGGGLLCMMAIRHIIVVLFFIEQVLLEMKIKHK